MEIVVIGSSGLIGSEAVKYFAECGHRIHGIDNNMRELPMVELPSRWDYARPCEP